MQEQRLSSYESTMKYFGLFASLFWLCKSAVAQDTSCFTNTTELFDYLAQVADGSDDITVVLCPDTVFLIGNIDGDSSMDGTMPLVTFPRVTYLCGEDGSSDNHCILENGDIQFWNPPGAAVGTVVVQGLTFQDATFVSIYLQGSGQISFIDCIIQNHVSAAPVIIDNGSFRRELSEARELQPSLQNVAFEGCVFADNQQRDPPAVFTYGVITVTSNLNTLLLDSCDFSNNVFDQDFGPGTYVVRSFGAPVDVTGSSFCENSVVGFGLVQVFSYEEDLVVENNGGSVDESLACSFFAVSNTIPEEDRQVTCVSFDAEACEEESDAPSLLPSSIPTTPSPTPEPTAVDTASPTRVAIIPAPPTPLPSSPPPTPLPTPEPTAVDTASPTRVATTKATPPPTPMPTKTSLPVPKPTMYPTKQPVYPPKKDTYPMMMKMLGMTGKGYSSSMSKSSVSAKGKGYSSSMSKYSSYGKKGYSSSVSKSSASAKGYSSSMSKSSASVKGYSLSMSRSSASGKGYFSSMSKSSSVGKGYSYTGESSTHMKKKMMMRGKPYPGRK
mmetsp:Transcript_5940/g.12194  ORF Transcript_5940/g.12194 Transcript_5940/m.12194 type:complete len:555 (-) Transcript_5940:97-1761(-)